MVVCVPPAHIAGVDADSIAACLHPPGHIGHSQTVIVCEFRFIAQTVKCVVVPFHDSVVFGCHNNRRKTEKQIEYRKETGRESAKTKMFHRLSYINKFSV